MSDHGGVFFFQAEDGIRDAQESRGLGDVYKRQRLGRVRARLRGRARKTSTASLSAAPLERYQPPSACLLYTSDAADDLPCVDLGGSRNITKKKQTASIDSDVMQQPRSVVHVVHRTSLPVP